MKMINAGVAPITDYAIYSKNCNLRRCDRLYLAPVQLLSDVQLFVNFGTKKPAEIKVTRLSLCNNASEVLETDCYIIANNGEYWYGIFTKFASENAYSSFFFALEVTYADSTTGTFFSEQYSIENSCEGLSKVQVCYPPNYNAEDLNNIYIGQPDASQDIMGNATMVYQHTYFVRMAEIVDTGAKITYTSNPTRNFASKINFSYEFRSELVPGWYKNYLVAIYFRGNFNINGVTVKASDLNLQNVLPDDGDLWKAYVKLDKELKGAFGCGPISCGDPCAPPPCVPVAFASSIILPTAIIDTPYDFKISLSGSPAFALSEIVKAAWMNDPVIILEGSVYKIHFTGTPTVLDPEGTAVTFTVTNDCGFVDFSKTVKVVPPIPSYLMPENYSGDYGAVTDICTFGATFSRTNQAQIDALADAVRVQATYHIVVDNTYELDVNVIFETADVNVMQSVDASAGGACAAADSVTCTAVVAI